MAWPLDRRVASAALALSAATVLAASARAPGVATATAGNGALDRFVALLDAGRGASAVVTYSFERTRGDGPRLAGEIVTVQRPELTIVSGMGTLAARAGDRQLSCTESEGRSGCLDRAAAAPGAELLDTFRAVAGAGHYAVTRDEGRTVAAEEAECFAVARVSEVPTPGATRSARYCFAHDGLLLLAEVERPSGVERRVATGVRRPARRADAEGLLDQFGAGEWLDGRSPG